MGTEMMRIPMLHVEDTSAARIAQRAADLLIDAGYTAMIDTQPSALLIDVRTNAPASFIATLWTRLGRGW